MTIILEVTKSFEIHYLKILYQAIKSVTDDSFGIAYIVNRLLVCRPKDCSIENSGM